MNYIPAYSPIFKPIEMSFYNCPIEYNPKGLYAILGGMNPKGPIAHTAYGCNIGGMKN